MRQKIYAILNKVYGILMTASFFAAFLPLIPFIIAIIVGGTIGEAISLFLYNQYYPWVIACASIAVLVGLMAMYFGKKEGLSIKSVGKSENKEQENK